jgi:ankyrin repeat protein/tetratricopeptide (TPR) repeat protein
VERPTWPFSAATCRRASAPPPFKPDGVLQARPERRAGRPPQRAGGPFHQPLYCIICSTFLFRVLSRVSRIIQFTIMKTKLALLLAVLVPLVAPAADELTAALQRGLFNEEAEQNLTAAIKAYQSVVAGADAQRKLAATAVFRLGECYRKLGQTNESVAQYQRILNDFTDQTNLVTLSRQNLVGLGIAKTSSAQAGDTMSIGLLEAVLAAKQADAAQANAQVQQLQALDPSDLRRILPTVAPDPLLNKLLEELSSSQTKAAEQSKKFTEGHPELRAVHEKIKALHAQIDDRTAGILQGLKVKAEVLTRQVEHLKQELANLATSRIEPGGGPVPSGMDPAARAQLKELLQGEIAIASQLLAEQRRKVQAGVISPAEVSRFERDVLGLNRQLLAVDGLTSTEDRKRWREMLVEEITLAEKAVQNERAKLDAGKSIASELAKLQRDVFALKRELVALDAAPVQSASLSALETNTTLTDAEETELKQIKAIIRDSPDLINAKAAKEMSRLQNAAEAGQVKVAEYLLANGADVNARFGGRGTPMHLAAERGHKTMTELLLRHGADANSGDSGGTPLHYAVENGHKAVAEVLLANQADPNAKGSGRRVTGGLTPLHVAVFHGFTTVAELLLANGAKVDSTDGGGGTALHTAATYGHPRAAQLLLTNKADVNALDNDGRTPLHAAAHVKHQVNPSSSPHSIARLLLEHQAEVNARIARGDHKGWTPLDLAAAYSDRAMAELLLANKAEIDAVGPFSQTPLTRAAGRNNPELVDALLAAGANVNAQQENRHTALSLAIYANDERTVSVILARKPDLEVRGEDNLTVLQFAVSSRKDGIAELLLQAGANPNVYYDQDGNTPLHWAVDPKRKPLVKLLLDHQANPNARNNSGRTPLDLTKSGLGFPSRNPSEQPAINEIAELLKQAGADEQLQRRGAISISRRSRDYLAPWFVQGSNTWNRFTLLELIAGVYAQSPPFAFPDFARVTISRLGSAGSKSAEIAVDVEALLASGDCSKDVPLEWGDVVEIPERDRKLNAIWGGLSFGEIEALKRCLDRKVDIIVKGEATKLTLTLTFIHPGGQPSTPHMSMFWLGSTVRNANVLRASSDLGRVKVRRVDPASKQPREIILNLERADPRIDLWLRDGDVIEVPEKDPNAAATSAPAAVVTPDNSPFRSIPSRSLRPLPQPK